MARLNHLSYAGRLGGLARVKKHGNPGTSEGRHRGGLRSIVVQKKLANNFKQLKEITVPPHSAKLAELIGIFMGDGHVGTYQASFSTNSETDLQHAHYTRKIIERLFTIKTGLAIRNDCKVCIVVVSSKKFCDYLRSQGLSHGNKVHGGLFIPAWIRKNRSYSRAFVRGLFDTDGSAYIDHHLRKGEPYQYMGLAFTNRAPALLDFFRSVLVSENLHPTQKTKYQVFLRREADIRQYFKVIGTSNRKHTNRIASLLLN